MNAKKKPNPPSVETKRALEEAKRLRAEAYAHKDKRIRSMLEDGVPKSEIASAIGVSHRYIQQVIARSAT